MFVDIEEGYKNRLKNKLFGLLCEVEKNGEWLPFLDSIIIELQGFPEEQKTINYIRNQEKHHARRSFQEEYKLFLQEYEIEYDERHAFCD